jgi:two-component system chemotaxis response regulator CheB
MYAIKHIMDHQPTPIVVLSAQGNSNMAPIMEALKMGAFDYLNKPVKNSSDLNLIRDEIIQKIKLAAASKVIRFEKREAITVPHTFDEVLNYDIVVIGSSTGGPPAIEKILTTLPANFALPIIIVQHMPANFVPSFAERLNSHCSLNVTLARKDAEIIPGNVYLAPGSRNMILKKNENGKVVVDFTNKIFREYNYPSINSVMMSAAEVYGGKVIGVVLTGMGKDGTEGIREIHKYGGYTIAQNKETSVVFGMPKEAIESGSVKQVVSINDISMFLVSCIS